MSVRSEASKNSHSGLYEASQNALRQFLSFALGKEEYGVNIMDVREIKGWTETTRLPNSPAYMRGVINLRGLIVPIFDLHSRFNMGQITPSEKNVVIILAMGERNIGILVDAVSDIVTVAENEIRPAPVGEERSQQAYVTGIISLDKRMVVLLDIGSLFEKEICASEALRAESSTQH